MRKQSQAKIDVRKLCLKPPLLSILSYFLFIMAIPPEFALGETKTQISIAVPHLSAGYMRYAVSPSGNFVASAGTDKSIIIWRTRDWRPFKTFTALQADVLSMSFRDDKHLLIGQRNGSYLEINTYDQDIFLSKSENEKFPNVSVFYDRYDRKYRLIKFSHDFGEAQYSSIQTAKERPGWSSLQPIQRCGNIDLVVQSQFVYARDPSRNYISAHNENRKLFLPGQEIKYNENCSFIAGSLGEKALYVVGTEDRYYHQFAVSEKLGHFWVFSDRVFATTYDDDITYIYIWSIKGDLLIKSKINGGVYNDVYQSGSGKDEFFGLSSNGDLLVIRNGKLEESLSLFSKNYLSRFSFPTVAESWQQNVDKTCPIGTTYGANVQALYMGSASYMSSCGKYAIYTKNDDVDLTETGPRPETRLHIHIKREYNALSSGDFVRAADYKEDAFAIVTQVIERPVLHYFDLQTNEMRDVEKFGNGRDIAVFMTDLYVGWCAAFYPSQCTFYNRQTLHKALSLDLKGQHPTVTGSGSKIVIATSLGVEEYSVAGSKAKLTKKIEAVAPTDNIHLSLDARYLFGNAPTLQSWDAQTGKQIFTQYRPSDHEWVVVTPEGFFDASPNGAKYLNLVRGLKSYSLGQAYQALYRPDLVRAKLAGDPEGKVKAAAAKLDLNKVVDSGAEPDVKFATTTGEAAGRTQDVAISVADAGGGIGKIEWRVNGVVQGLDEGGVARNTALDEDGDPKPSGKTVDLRRTLQLSPGENRIEVVAYNAAGLIASEPVGITLTRKADQVAAEPKVETTPRLFVLAVGVNDYFDGRLRLAYAVPDAKALADGFKQAGAGLYSDVQVTTLLNQDVTMARLDATFADLGTKMKPTDVFVFFIAGHGKTVDGHYHFIPYDFRYLNANSILTDGIDQDHFQTWLARIPARKSLMLTDTCESGSLTEDPMRVASRGLETVEAQNAAIELLTRAVGRTVLSASTDDAPALEGYRGHGVFSYAVLDALAHAQAGGDGFITVTSLAGFVDQRVQDVSYKAFHIRQIPQMKVVGSNFPVAHRLTASLVEEDGTSDQAATVASDGAAISGKPTHVLIAPVTVRATADAAGVAVTDLPPGTQVTLVQTANGWTIVARDGKKLGYVKNDTLVRMQ